MNKLNKAYPVAIVGGGPVGLFLAILLRLRNIDCVVLEKRTSRITHSRSLGIHPVSLELMEEIGLANPLIEEGIKIRRGMAWSDHKKLGVLSFESCPGPYRFVLSLPQYKTEQLLENKLNNIDPRCLVRGARLAGLKQNRTSVDLSIQSEGRGGQSCSIRCNLLVGCDGNNSFVRNAAGFSFDGKQYPDTYVMGDFSDNTDLGNAAGIFLHSAGLIESFPLGRERRRWVVKTDHFIPSPDRTTLETMIRRRINHELSGTTNYMLSSFGVQKYLANPMANRRIFLAGDAAHIISPIGGQGMNLGWFDAHALSGHLKKMITGKADPAEQGEQYSASRRRAARKAARRAELNMRLGRSSLFPYPKNGLVWLMLNTPLKRLMAQVFTMRGLDKWPI
ncbi:FAD-dependent oxidoreductase [Halalkalibaculum sp. DA3122]